MNGAFTIYWALGKVKVNSNNFTVKIDVLAITFRHLSTGFHSASFN